jgi:multiple sugar transport system substrate-binding protein
MSRRRFLRNAGLAGLSVGPFLSACATSASSGPVAQTGGAVTVQSNLSAPAAKKAIDAMVAGFNDRGGATASVNTVASETFRTQLPSYLTSANPPDTYTWYPGSLLSGYAEKDLLLDVGDVWQTMDDYSEAFRTLASDGRGKQIFVPTTYYWWGIFYRKSKFAEWGVTPPKDWRSFLTLCETLASKGVAPIGLGAGGNTPWIASGWFDYLDIRINGAQFHRDLLAGRKRFDDPKVKAVFATWKEALPHFDPSGTAVAFQDATTSLLQGRTGMLLIGAFLADSAPKDVLDDVDFFQFPIIDPAVPVAEEGPTDGFFASSRTPRKKEVAEFLKYAATAQAQDLYIRSSTGTVLPTNPSAHDSGTALVKKGRQLLRDAKELTQFFNRDSSDALQPTADAALVRFIQKPNELDSILSDWQSAAEKVWHA